MSGTTWNERHAGGAEPVGEGLDARGLALRHERPRTRPSTRFGSTICGRTSCGRATTAARGWRSPTACRRSASINAVHEDTYRRGLLFAASELGVYVSFDDGENWQSLRLNMPATSIRDLVVKDDDLVVGTHGRGFWILDDITPLRQITAGHHQGAGVSVLAGAGVSRALEREHGHAAAARRAGRARIRRTASRSATSSGQASPARSRLDIVEGLTGEVHPALLERRPAGLAGARAQHPRLLAAPGRDALDRAGPASIRVGHAVRAAAG